MLDLLRNFKEIAKEEPVCIDNVVFRLHSRATVAFLTICAMIVSVKTFFGEPISCIGDEDIKFPTAAINAFCFIQSTFIVVETKPGILGVHNIGPGVLPATYGDIIEQRYYKWVCIILAMQALIFYTPRALWGVWEKNILSFLSKDLETPLPHEAWTAERRNRLVSYFVNADLRSHNAYAIRFLICETLNLVISVSQIYMLDLFLGGHFSFYGPAVAAFTSAYDSKEMIDPMARLFPIKAKCNITTFGPSGSIVHYDLLCVNMLNVINEKIFIVLWFWLILLAILGTFSVIYRVTVFTQPWARIYLLQAQTRLLSRRKLLNVVTVLHFGDWFLLHQLADNVNPVVFRELVDELAIAVSTKHSNA